jgi:hypothetical protein
MKQIKMGVMEKIEVQVNPRACDGAGPAKLVTSCLCHSTSGLVFTATIIPILTMIDNIPNFI